MKDQETNLEAAHWALIALTHVPPSSICHSCILYPQITATLAWAKRLALHCFHWQYGFGQGESHNYENDNFTSAMAMDLYTTSQISAWLSDFLSHFYFPTSYNLYVIHIHLQQGSQFIWDKHNDAPINVSNLMSSNSSTAILQSLLGQKAHIKVYIKLILSVHGVSITHILICHTHSRPIHLKSNIFTRSYTPLCMTELVQLTTSDTK